MKQSFGKTLMSCFLTVTLMASVLAGAISVTCSPAKANGSAASGDAYLDDIYDYLVSTAAFNTTTLTQWFEYVNGIVENDSPDYFVVALEEGGSWLITVYQFRWDVSQRSLYTFYTSYNSVSGVSWFGNSNSNWNYCEFNRVARLKYVDGWGYCDLNSASVSLYETQAYTWVKNQTSTSDYAVPSYYEYSRSGRNVYCSKAFSSGQNSSYSYSVNLFAGSATVYFDLGVFWLGTRQYLSILQQDLMRDLDPEHLNDAELIVYLYAAGEGDYKTFSYDDVTLIPGDWQFFVNLNFTNVSPMGLYVIDITGNDWDIITGAEIYDSDSFPDPYAISDSRIEMNQGVPGTDGTPDSYTQSFNYFAEYVNNYNQTHVIPESLAETLFGVEGGKLYPVTVSEPSNVAATRNDGALVDGNLYTFQWAMTEPNHLGYNYELYDVVIIPSNYAGYFGLVYFYDASLNPAYQFVDRVSFDSLLNSFDCIIIVPDDAGTLEDNTWWQQLVPSSMRGDMAVGGTSSLGVEYVDTVSGNEFQGFMIVTKKAIQKQQLYVFNDGITKTYKLMSDYIDKRGDWEDSFLAWTASLFEQWQTLDGRLSSIYSLLFDLHLSDWMVDISSKLDQIVNNTGEFEWNFWYMSLFSWVNQFKPDNSDFAAGLQQYDNNWEEFPELPAPSTIPLLPTIGG